jgi:peptidoglycan/LPS O-acetylase OafA/YrhL
MSVTGVRRLEPLTGLRIFAALVVFLSHIPKPPGAPAFLQAFMDAGYSGVTLFFILSGFIIAWNYEPVLGERLTGSALRTFYVARLARIYPLYLGALLLVILPTIDTVGDVGEDLSSGVFWTHLFALQGWAARTSSRSIDPPGRSASSSSSTPPSPSC